MPNTEIWTIEQARAYFESGGKKKPPNPTKKAAKKPIPASKRGDKEKGKLEWALKVFCDEHGYTYEREYKFHPIRKWRYDYFIPELKAAIEYEGLMSEKSGHTTITGYTSDTEKYNAANALGHKVLRYTALNYTNLTNDLKELLKCQLKTT